MSKVASSALRRSCVFVASCLCVSALTLPTPAFAQLGQTSDLEGTVTDTSGGVLAGVSLTISSPSLIGGARQLQSGDDGRYRLSSLPPGIYEVNGSRDGFKTVRHVDVMLLPGSGVTLDLQLEVSPVAETVNVSGAAPTIDVRSSAVPIVIDREFIDNLPLDRRVIDFINLVPGVTANTALGGSLGANPFSLDGTGGNEPGFGSPVAAPSANWIDAVQVVSLGSSAEYGEFTGARLNAITRSGSNRYSGLIEYWTTKSNWTGNNRGSLAPNLARQFKPLEVLEQWDTTNQLGGPVLRDRLWFFAGMEYFKYARRPSAFATTPRTTDEPRMLTREPKLFLKFTTAPIRSSRVEGYFSAFNSKGTNLNASPLVRPEALSSSDQPARMGNVSFTWPLGDRTLLETRYGDFAWDQSNGPTPPSSRAGPAPHFDTFTRVTSVNALSFSDTQIRTTSLAATVTRYLDRVAGVSHSLKAGIEYERARETSTSGFPGGAQYNDNNGTPAVLYLWDGSTYRGSQWRTAVFLQDQWRLVGPLTIEPGVRFGLYRGAVPIDGVTGYKNHSISPRLGVAWDVNADHHTVVRAHYGRYHDPLVTSYYDFFDPLGPTPQTVMQVDDSGQFREILRSQTSSRYRIDPDTKHSFTDEYLVGVERELPVDLVLRAQYVRRNFKESIGFIDVGTAWTPTGVTDPGPDNVRGTSDDGGPMTVYYDYPPDDADLILTNPTGAFRRYDALEFVAIRRSARGLDLQASYTWARTRGNFNNEFSSNAANNDLSVNGDFVNPNRALFSEGRTTRDYPHDVKVLGTYPLPWGGVRLSVVYRYTSGRPWARTVNFGPLTQLLGTRVEPIGSQELPATNSADMRVEKTFKAGTAAIVGLFATVFNVNNQGVPFNAASASGPNFGLPIAWVDPRRVRAGVRVIF